MTATFVNWGEAGTTKPVNNAFGVTGRVWTSSLKASLNLFRLRSICLCYTANKTAAQGHTGTYPTLFLNHVFQLAEAVEVFNAVGSLKSVNLGLAGFTQGSGKSKVMYIILRYNMVLNSLDKVIFTDD